MKDGCGSLQDLMGTYRVGWVDTGTMDVHKCANEYSVYINWILFYCVFPHKIHI